MDTQKNFNFIWWFATPFFIIFFFIILLMHIEGKQFAIYALNMLTFLILIPIFFELFTALTFKWKIKTRNPFIFLLYILGFWFTYKTALKFYLPDIKYFYLVFVAIILSSYILFFLNLNQYAFLLAGFTTLTIWISAYTLFDLIWIIIPEFLFTALLFSGFIFYKIDTQKNIAIAYISGVILTITAIFGFSFIF
jgi:hypothetical protein